MSGWTLMRSKYGTAVLEGFEKPLVIHPNWPDLQCGGEDAIVRVEAEGRCWRCAYFLAKLDEIVREAKKYDVQLISFPELYLEGYTLTPELVQQLAEPVDGPSIARVAALARAHHLSIICPYAARDDRGEEARYYDAIAVLGATVAPQIHQAQ
jgi:hypothetical protein